MELQEELENAFEILLNCFDIKSFIQEQSLNVFLEDMRSIVSHLDLNCTKINTFINSLTCMSCEDALPTTVLSCSHYFCESCLSNQIRESTQGLVIVNQYESHLSPRCNKCQSIIHVEEYMDLFAASWSQYQSDSKEREELMEIEKTHLRRCTECNSLRKDNEFIYECMHLCIYCGSNRIRQGSSECSHCGCQVFIPNILEKLITSRCPQCRKNKSYIEDRMLDICQDHVHCFDCLVESSRTLKCLKCSKILNSESMKKINNQIFTQCYFCNNMLDANFFIVKGCCTPKVCIYCQKAKSLTNCAYCSGELAVSQMIYFEGLDL